MDVIALKHPGQLPRENRRETRGKMASSGLPTQMSWVKAAVSRVLRMSSGLTVGPLP